MATMTGNCKANNSERLSRPYSSYNIFFILERFRLLERNGWIDNQIQQSHMLTGYEDLELPPLPPKYKHLETTLPNGWYMPGKKKQSKRKHKKTHGCKSFMTMLCFIKSCITTTGSSHACICILLYHIHSTLCTQSGIFQGNGTGNCSELEAS